MALGAELRSNGAFLARDPIVRLMALVSALVSLPYVVPILSPDNLETFGWLVADFPIFLATILAFEFRLSRVERSSERLFWHLCSGAWLAWLAVRTVHLVAAEAMYDDPGLNLLTDLLYVSGYLCMVLALETRPHQRDARIVPRLQAIGSSGAAVFLFGLLVYFAVLPKALEPELYGTWIPSLLMFALLDVYLVFRLARLYREAQEQRWRRAYGWILTAYVCYGLLDTLELLSMSVIELPPHGTLVDFLWFPPIWAMVAAARSREAPEPAGAPAPVDEGEERRGLGGRLVAYAVMLPILHLALYVTGVLDPALQSARAVCVLVVFGVLALMASAYQRILERENRRLDEQREALNEQFELSERMEAVGRLAGGIAHDFNNLLQVIQGSSDMLREDVQDEVSLANVGAIHKAAGRAASLTDQLLTISRRSLSEPTAFELNQAVIDLVAMLRRVIGSGIEIETRLGPDVECVRVDQGQFEQSIMNLAVNARDAMPYGGRIGIETYTEALDEVILHPGLEPGRYVTLVVRDSGHGIDEDVQPHVFEPFFTTKERGKGTGLGLSMVYAFVKHNGGHIEVESAPGEGATFRLLLPHVAAGEARESAEVVVPLARSRGVETVLVVEDEEPVRSVLCSILRGHGYVVLEADGPRLALEMATSGEHAIDLLLTDVVMPDMTGLELADLVLEVQPRTHVLFVSGYSGDAWQDRDDFEEHVLLRKPFTREALLATVDAVLASPPEPLVLPDHS